MVAYLLALTVLFGTAFAAETVREELVPSTPEQIAALTSDDSYLIGGIISPLTGHPVLHQIDFVAKGAENIPIQRTYISSYIPQTFVQAKVSADYEKKLLYNHLFTNYKGWITHPHMRLEVYTSSKIVRVPDPSGAVLEFKLSGNNDCIATLVASPFMPLTTQEASRSQAITTCEAPASPTAGIKSRCVQAMV